MGMNIKIVSEIPCSIFYEGAQKIAPFSIITKEEERVQLSVLPSSPEKYSAYTLIITITNDKIADISGGARVICWGEGRATIHLAPPKVQFRFTPRVLGQKKLNKDLVTLYDDGIKKIMCEGTSFYTFDLPEGVENLKMKVKELDRGAIVCVNGRVQDKEYLLALYSNEQEWKIMHELIADEIVVLENGVKTVEVLPTMLRHEVRSFYPAFSTAVKRDFVPTIKHSYPDILLPYLFFVSLFMGDENFARLLDDGLSNDRSAILEFIGEVDTVVSPDFGEWDLDVVALYNSKERIIRPDLYKIKVENGKISNIIHLLTCN